jgi:chromosome segregation ATPase
MRHDTIGPALTARIREVLTERPATESELRTLAEHAEAWMRALNAQIRSSEQRVAELSSDPAAALAPIAAELRRIEGLRPELVEVTTLHEELENRARALRTEWLLRQAESAPSRPRP